MEILDLEETLLKGEVTLEGQFTLGSNYTFLVSTKYKQTQLKAVYKPQQGEQPLWDFPENTLANREVAAFQLSQLLGWNLVPHTIFRANGPYGPGSYQLYIEYNPNYHFFVLKPKDLKKLTIVALFDLITNNADRKGSHILFSKEGHRLYAIDHGLCFNEEDKLRTVIWNFAGQPIPIEPLQDLTRILANPAELNTALAPYLAPKEIAALRTRAETILLNPVFPYPPEEKRAYPYPPL